MTLLSWRGSWSVYWATDGPDSLRLSESGLKVNRRLRCACAVIFHCVQHKPGIAGPHILVTVKANEVSHQCGFHFICKACPQSDHFRGWIRGAIHYWHAGCRNYWNRIWHTGRASYLSCCPRGPSSTQLVSRCADWKGNANSCYEISAIKAAMTSDGMERVTFNSPTSFGRKWNVRFIVSNSYTGQSVFVDSSDPSSTIDKKSIWLNYANPKINSVAIEQRDGTSMHYTLTVTGSNFCDGNVSDAAIYLFVQLIVLTLQVVYGRMIPLVTILYRSARGSYHGLTPR